MSDELYAFAVLRAEQAESYEKNDIKAYIRRIDEQESTIGAQALKLKGFKRVADEYKEAAKNSNFQATKAIDLAAAEHKKRVRASRGNKLLIIAAGVGGFLLGSR